MIKVCTLRNSRTDSPLAFFCRANNPLTTTDSISVPFECSFLIRICFSGESDTLVCLEDGLWSYPEAYCKIECPDPPSVPNATLLVPQCHGGGHDVGTVCRYKCNPGYYITGTLNKKPRK